MYTLADMPKHDLTTLEKSCKIGLVSTNSV